MTEKSPLVARLYQYQRERFPFAIVFLTSLAVLGSALAMTGIQVGAWQMIAGYLTLVLFPFHMRLFDEIKDYEHDRNYYPDRPVSRGLISLREIKIILGAVIAFLIFINLWWGVEVFIALLIAFAYAGLAAKEFFLRSWLRKHFFTYLAFHQLQLAFVLPYIYLLFGAEINFNNRPLVGHFFMVFTLLFLLEWARKMRREENEVKSRDTYSARLGRPGSAAVYILLAVISVAFFALAARIIFSAGEIWGWAALFPVVIAGLSYARNLYKRSDEGVQLSALGLFIALNALLGISMFL